MKNEKEFQSFFTHWVWEHYDSIVMLQSAAFELKFVKGKRLPYAKVKEHQLNALSRSKHETLIYKLSDLALGIKPYDCFALKRSQAFIVILFYIPRARNEFYMIDVDTFIKYREKSERKSITKEEARKICYFWDVLNN